MQGNIDTTQQPRRLEDARAERAEGEGVALKGMQTAEDVGRVGPIGREEVNHADQLLKEYKQGKANLENRIVENEQWYKGRHWGIINSGGKVNPGDPEPASAWLLNSISNKHADAMDNYPEPNVLPREEADEQDAKLLSDVIPVVLEQNDYQTTYSDVWWDKLKCGTGVTGVFWDSSKNNGLGDVDIRPVDLLQLYWEPGITDLQKSANIFHVELVDREALQAQYPFLATALMASDPLGKTEYLYDDTVDTTKKTLVVDWYYKVKDGGRDIVHYCKYVCGEVIYASENDPEYAQRGFYDHGKYPFILDPLFPVKGTPCGFGYIDVCKSPQLYIDKLDQVMIKHAVMGARQRYFVRGDGSVNEDEFADTTKDFVHFTGSGNPNDSLIPIVVPEIGGTFLDLRTLKIDEMKETSSNRDFSQGSTASGVTAASAIAALQEAGSKTSRDMIKASYNSFVQICYLVIELIRQFYREDRFFRIVGQQGQMEFVRFNGAQIAARPQGNDFGLDMGYRVPIFDIKVTSQKSSPFSTVAQNERAKELYGMGFFRPDLADQALAALDMMDFEGIEQVRQRIAENGTLYQQVQQMQQQLVQLAAIVDKTQGSQILPAMVQQFGMQDQAATANGSASNAREQETNSLGTSFTASADSTAGKARTRAARTATPE